MQLELAVRTQSGMSTAGVFNDSPVFALFPSVLAVLTTELLLTPSQNREELLPSIAQGQLHTCLLSLQTSFCRINLSV